MPSTGRMCLPQSILELHPSVFHCHPVVSHLSFRCCFLLVTWSSRLPLADVVFQLFPSSFQICSHDSLAVVFHLAPTTVSCLPELILQSFLNSLLVVSELPPRCGFPVFESVNADSADGLQGWVNCVQLSGCIS